MSLKPTTASRLRTLLEAVEILNRHDEVSFADRVILASHHLFEESLNSFELWHRETGNHEGALNVPYDPKDLAERFARIGELAPTQHPAFPQIVAGVREPLRISDFASLRQLRRTEFFEVTFKPVNLRHQVAIPVFTETHLGGITFNKGGLRDFTEDDMILIQIFGRHTAQAHRTSKIIEAATARQPSVEALDYTPLRRAGLTRRQCEVLHWICEGKRDREIAIILGISYRTVTEHVSSILGILGVETRGAAAAAAAKVV